VVCGIQEDDCAAFSLLKVDSVGKSAFGFVHHIFLRFILSYPRAAIPSIVLPVYNQRIDSHPSSFASWSLEKKIGRQRARARHKSIAIRRKRTEQSIRAVFDPQPAVLSLRQVREPEIITANHLRCTRVLRTLPCISANTYITS
jgi:hypothetical protein